MAEFQLAPSCPTHDTRRSRFTKEREVLVVMSFNIAQRRPNTFYGASRKSSDSREESGRAQKQRRGEGVDLCSAVQIVE